MSTHERRRIACVGQVLLTIPVFVFSSSIATASCRPQNAKLRLTPERLAAVGFKATGWMSHVNLSTLSVRFDKPTRVQLPVNPQGDLMSVELVPLAVNITGTLLPAGHQFRKSIRARLPANTSRLKYSVTRGKMSFIGRSKIALKGKITGKKYWLKLRVGKATAAARITVNLLRTKENKDLSVDAQLSVGKAKVTSWLKDAINLVLGPITIATGLTGQTSVGGQVLKRIGARVDRRVAAHMVDVAEFVDNYFDIDSVNDATLKEIWGFSNIFKEKLRYVENAGFYNAGYYRVRRKVYDVQVGLRLNKASIPEDHTTYLTRKAACQLHETIRWFQRS